MAHQFSYEQITQLRDTAATLASQSLDHERALGVVLDAAELTSAGALHLRRAAREHCVAIDRLVTAVGHRQDRGAGERSRPHAVLVVDDYQDS
ncbi:MAG: hypothetical protein ABI983_03515, partial [Acidobacteriota bacterium]